MNEKLSKKIKSIFEKSGQYNYSKVIKNDKELTLELQDSYNDFSIPEIVYLAFNPDFNPYCKRNKKRAFASINKGYRKFCTGYCPCRKENQSKIISKQWSNKSQEEKDEILLKCKNTNIERYGVSNAAQSPEIKAKTQKTNLLRYGVKTPLKSKKIQQKIQKNYFEKTGFKTPLENPQVQEKIQKNLIKKYGSLMTHARTASIKKYNGNPFANAEIKEKIKQTNLKQFGVDHPSKNSKIKDKKRQTFFKKYNRFAPSQIHIPDESWKIINDKNEFTQLYNEHGMIRLTKHLNISYDLAKSTVDKFKLNRRGCRSVYEETIANWLKQNNIKFKTDDRTVCAKHLNKKLEIDFVIPQHNLAIEFNGLYYHSSLFKSKYYHLQKTKVCQKEGLHLIHIFEDEFLEKQNLVFSILSNQLKISQKEPVEES